MFTWICPKCGSEVPPSENECPNCRALAKSAATATSSVETEQRASALRTAEHTTSASPMPSNVYSGSSTNPISGPAIYPPSPVRRATTLSPLLVGVCSAVGIVALLAILYIFVLPRGSSGRAATVVMEKPGESAANTFNAHPLAKYIEITGLRLIEGGAGQVRIAFIAVNHSPADLPELDGHLTLTGGDKSVFSFPVVIPSIGPFESKDISSTVRTSLKPYELPDWQALKPTLRIVAER